MKIVQYPHPALRWKSKTITEINAQLCSTVREMFDLMYESKGVGLAANQVALPYRLFIVNVTADPQETDEECVFINPEIIHRKGSSEGEEGCLSFPEMYAQVRRAGEIVVEAFDLQGRGFEISLEEMPGRVVQHEADHLDGILLIDRMSETARRELQPKLDDLETVFRREQAEGVCPSDEELKKRMKDLEPS